MNSKSTIAVTLIVALGSLGLTSTASADDAPVKAAGEAHDAQFASIARKQDKATKAWVKAGHSKRASRPLLRILKQADRLDAVTTREVKAQSPSTPVGAQAKENVLRSNANYSRYLRTLGRAIRLAVARKVGAANRQLRQADGYAELSGRQAQAARDLFAQVL